MTRDYYDVLGVKPGASIAEILAAYKRLARRYHPDVNQGSKSAEESFKQVAEAYQVLSDPQKRRQYDTMRMMGGSPGGMPHGAPRSSGRREGSDPFGGFTFRADESGSSDFGDLGGIFSDLFGRAGAGAGGPRRGTDLEYEASVDFEEAVRGTTITIPLARTVACDACGGSGTLASGAECARCRGEGVTRGSETIHARIPAGAEDGSRVRVPGAGEAGRRGGPPGDLYIVLRVKPHRFFRREGGDIVLEVPLTYAEAALGARVEVPTIDGHSSLTIPPGTRSGQRFRLRGKGAPAKKRKGRGDQIVVVGITPPLKIDTRTRELLEELERLDGGNPREDLDW